MDSFFNSIKSAAASTTTTEGGENKGNPDQPSTTELLSSAKVVAEAAQSAFSNKTVDNIDKEKVAGAAGDILDAAQQYGKFDENQGVGQYLKKAEDYLHQYEKSDDAKPPPPTTDQSPPPTTDQPPPPNKDQGPPPNKDQRPPPAGAEEPPAEKGGKEDSGSGFDAGDVMKMAGSFLNK